MDDQLALRIKLFRESGQVRPEVASFVTDELAALDARGNTVTEDTAGMLTSHLMMALTRMLDGESIDSFTTDFQVAEELADHPDAVEAARGIAGRAARALGAALPESEINFLALHLAVLGQHSAA